MSVFTKTGAEALAPTTGDSGGSASLLTPFPSGTTFKVRVKTNEAGVYDAIAEYFGYGIFKKVNTFVPKNPAQRNAKGYVTGSPTVWDRASELLYADAKAAKEAGDLAKEDELKKEAALFKGKRKYLLAFANLETGEDIIVDLTPKQKEGVIAVITKYAKKLDKLAFELSKTGESTGTVVTLSPLLDFDEDLTEKERENFAKAGEKPFDFAEFDNTLYIADEEEQIKNLVIAGFDIARLGLSIGAGASNASNSAASAPTDAGGTSADITDDDLPF